MAITDPLRILETVEPYACLADHLVENGRIEARLAVVGPRQFQRGKAIFQCREVPVDRLVEIDERALYNEEDHGWLWRVLGND